MKGSSEPVEDSGRAPSEGGLRMVKRTTGRSVEVSAEDLASISSPDRVETPFGGFEFFDGLPLPETVDRSYDALDLLRAIDVFLNCVPGASMLAMRNGLRSVGIDVSNKLAVTDPKADSAQLMLTANTVTTYGTGFLDLRRDGPTVVEAPPNSLSFVDDAWQRYVADMGLAGPDKGEGGKYLFLPPGYSGEVPDGYFVARSATYSNWIVIRALGGIESLETTRIYPLAAADSPPEMEFINIARVAFNGTHSNDFSFFEEINTIVQEEPPEALDPERAGQIASIGIVKGQPFAPDERLHEHPRHGRTGRGGDRSHASVQAPRPTRLLLPRRLLEERLRRRQLRVPQRGRGAAARHAGDDALRRHGDHPRDDPSPRRRRLAIRIHRRGRDRGVARRRQPLHAPTPCRHPGQDVLVDRHLRHPDPRPAPDRQPVAEHQQLRRRDPVRPRPTATP